MLKKIKLFSLFSFAATFFISCSSAIPLQYKNLENVKIQKNNEEPSVLLDVQLYNPNPIGIKLKELNAAVAVDGKTVGNAAIENALRIKRKSEFVLPIVCETSYTQLGELLKNSAGLFLSGKEIPVSLSGTITIKKFIFFKRTYSFSYQENVKASELLK